VISLIGNRLSGDAGAEGLFVKIDGNSGIGTLFGFAVFFWLCPNSAGFPEKRRVSL